MKAGCSKVQAENGLQECVGSIMPSWSYFHSVLGNPECNTSSCVTFYGLVHLLLASQIFLARSFPWNFSLTAKLFPFTPPTTGLILQK